MISWCCCLVFWLCCGLVLVFLVLDWCWLLDSRYWVECWEKLFCCCGFFWISFCCYFGYSSRLVCVLLVKLCWLFCWLVVCWGWFSCCLVLLCCVWWFCVVCCGFWNFGLWCFFLLFEGKMLVLDGVRVCLLKLGWKMFVVVWLVVLVFRIGYRCVGVFFFRGWVGW